MHLQMQMQTPTFQRYDLTNAGQYIHYLTAGDGALFVDCGSCKQWKGFVGRRYIASLAICSDIGDRGVHSVDLIIFRVSF